MIKNTVFLIFILLLAGSCSKDEGCVRLSENYRLWIVGSNERYITNDENIYILGPRVDEIGISGPYIIGRNSRKKVKGLKNEPGFFFIDTEASIEKFSLAKNEFLKILREKDISLSKMKGASTVFYNLMKSEKKRCKNPNN